MLLSKEGGRGFLCTPYLLQGTFSEREGSVQLTSSLIGSFVKKEEENIVLV
jgi:hypothetical protein